MADDKTLESCQLEVGNGNKYPEKGGGGQIPKGECAGRARSLGIWPRGGGGGGEITGDEILGTLVCLAVNMLTAAYMYNFFNIHLFLCFVERE